MMLRTRIGRSFVKHWNEALFMSIYPNKRRSPDAALINSRNSVQLKNSKSYTALEIYFHESDVLEFKVIIVFHHLPITFSLQNSVLLKQLKRA